MQRDLSDSYYCVNKLLLCMEDFYKSSHMFSSLFTLLCMYRTGITCILNYVNTGKSICMLILSLCPENCNPMELP